MQYWLGLDGGGTKTHLKIRSDAGETVAEGLGGGSNIVSLSEDRVAENLQSLISDGLTKASIEKKACTGVCIGSAGVRQEVVRRKLYSIVSEILPYSRIYIVSDGVPVLYSGFRDGAGVALVSGTGSVCLARGKTGTIHCIGGFGHILGDEGSGYAIGLDLLKAILWEYDGRGEKTCLTPLLSKKLKCDIPTGILDFAYSSKTGKAEIAALSPLCDEACAMGDVVARRIIARAARALYQMYRAAADRAELTEEQRSRCLLTGGVGTNSRFLRTAFESELRASVQGASLIEAACDAATACCMIARNVANETKELKQQEYGL